MWRNACSKPVRRCLGQEFPVRQELRGIVRSSFLIDGDGKVLQVTYGVKPEDTVPRAQEALAQEPLTG